MGPSPATVTRNSWTESSGIGNTALNPELMFAPFAFDPWYPPMPVAVVCATRPEFWLLFTSAPSKVTLFWSRRAPNTSPLEVTPGCTLSSSTTFRVCSGICLTCISLNGFPMLASVVFTWETSDATFTTSPVALIAMAKSSVAGVFTSSLTSLRVIVANPSFSAVTL